MDLVSAYAIVAALAFGAAVGSFAGAVVYRIPRQESIVRPRSRCPSCGQTIAWYDNVPLVSYLLLRGRCRRCGERISVRYPIIEATVALAWGLVAFRFGLTLVLPAYLVFVTTLVILSAIDLEHRLLPNRVLYPAAVIGGVLLVAASIATEPSRMVEAAVGGLSYGLPMLGVALLVPGGMGLGDVKLAFYLGAHLGWLGLERVLVGALLGFIGGGVVSVVLVALRLKGRKDRIPFGPYMAAGAAASLLWGQAIFRAWLG